VYDTVPIVAQWRVLVLADDTVGTLGQQVLQREHQFLVETLASILAGETRLNEL